MKKTGETKDTVGHVFYGDMKTSKPELLHPSRTKKNDDTISEAETPIVKPFQPSILFDDTITIEIPLLKNAAILLDYYEKMTKESKAIIEKFERSY